MPEWKDIFKETERGARFRQVSPARREEATIVTKLK